MFEALLVRGAACKPGSYAGAALPRQVPSMVRHNVCMGAVWCSCGSMEHCARPRALPITRFARFRGDKKVKQDQQADGERAGVQELAAAVMPLITFVALAGVGVQVTLEADRLSADLDKQAIRMDSKLQSLRADMRADRADTQADLESKLQSLRADMRADLERIDSKLESLQARFEFDARLSRLEGRQAKE